MKEATYAWQKIRELERRQSDMWERLGYKYNKSISRLLDSIQIFSHFFLDAMDGSLKINLTVLNNRIF